MIQIEDIFHSGFEAVVAGTARVRLRPPASSPLRQPQALAGDEQAHTTQPLLLKLADKCRPIRLIFIGALLTAKTCL